MSDKDCQQGELMQLEKELEASRQVCIGQTRELTGAHRLAEFYRAENERLHKLHYESVSAQAAKLVAMSDKRELTSFDVSGYRVILGHVTGKPLLVTEANLPLVEVSCDAEHEALANVPPGEYTIRITVLEQP